MKTTGPAKIYVVQGANLGLLGFRDPQVYGGQTLLEIHNRLKQEATSNGFEMEFFQSDIEGEIVQHIGRIFLSHMESSCLCLGLIINPGAYTHTSIAIRDALENLHKKSLPIIEVHLSNIFARESFRHHSYISPVVSGTICGLGSRGYDYALTEIMLAHKQR